VNHSIYSADRATHLKIVAVSLIAGIVVLGFGISARIDFGDRDGRTMRMKKVNEVVMITSAGANLVR
jgi:hypothetical protein